MTPLANFQFQANGFQNQRLDVLSTPGRGEIRISVWILVKSFTELATKGDPDPQPTWSIPPRPWIVHTT